jgi:hypothetical protein
MVCGFYRDDWRCARQLRLHHPIPAPGPMSTSRWQERSSPILDTAF